MKEALLYEKIEDNKVRCILCSHRCVIQEGHLGVCNVRENRGGSLFTLVYGKTISQHIDPVEKKPLYHFYPGSTAYSIATPGCNFRCQWCQNWEIAQLPREQNMIPGYDAPPETIIREVISNDCKSIAYTYTEPTIFFEYTLDIARLASAEGIANIYVTNGYMTSEMLGMISPFLDAANVDVKAFQEKSYKHYTGSRLQPILDNLVLMKKLGIWIEITTLVVPGINDDLLELKRIAQFIHQELGSETPWHLSRFYPHYKLANVPPTPVATLNAAKEIGYEVGLKHIYLGNVGGESNTYCDQCRELLIRRLGYWVEVLNLQAGSCTNCGSAIAGIWEKE